MDQRTGFLIKRAEQALMAEKDAALRPLGLTVPQYAALLVLEASPGLSSAELARGCLVTPQNMAVVVTNLIGKDLIERRPHAVHERVVEIRLTGRGRRLLARADTVALAVERRLDDALGDEAAHLRQLLATAAEALRGRPTAERDTG